MPKDFQKVLPAIGDEIVVNEFGSQIHGYVTGFGNKDGMIVKYQPWERPAVGTLGTKWCRIEDVLAIASNKGSIGKHDWAVEDKGEEGFAVFVDDRQLSYRSDSEKARSYALEIIDRLVADGDYRLNDKPAGWLPPHISGGDSDWKMNTKQALSHAAVGSLLARHDEGCYSSKISYYADIESLAEKVRSSKCWSQGEVFVHAQSEQKFIVMKQIAPSSCEMMTISQNGFHDVLTAYRFGQEELVKTLASLLELPKVEDEPNESPSPGM